ncbi:MAG: endonuclease/exonuclease/phosphatase family protein [Ruminococcaceae bacterium]|nr:endonuclease/exonuclease/phosphatase family protein [Oscillospiraceae bacterium]
MKTTSKAKKIVKTIFIILLIFILIVAIYVAYVYFSYNRIEDELSLEINDKIGSTAMVGEEYKIISYNIGFAAYTPEFTFFMDGGKESKAASKESVLSIMTDITNYLKAQNPDFAVIQEVDVKATRTYHVDESKILVDAFPDYDSVFAVNWDSAYLAYPFFDHHGKTLAGMQTFSRFNMDSSVRFSLPVEDTLMKFVDLDRCLTLSRIPTSNSKELVIINHHLSAYTSDGKIADEQLKLLVSLMKKEYEKGNYVIAGGDFNKDLIEGGSENVFGVKPKDGYTWAQEIDRTLIKDAGLELVTPFNADKPLPSCRNCDVPLSENPFKVTVDGFIVSPNVTIIASDVCDINFKYSDHNPVYLTFVLAE